MHTDEGKATTGRLWRETLKAGFFAVVKDILLSMGLRGIDKD